MQIYARFNLLARPINPFALGMIGISNQTTNYVVDQYWQVKAGKLWQFY